MYRLIIATFTKAIIALTFAGSVANASDDPNHIADYIRYEVRVIEIIPVDIEHMAKAHKEFAELLIESENEELQLAYVKQSIIGTLAMVPFDDRSVTLDSFKEAIEKYAGDGAIKPTLADYAILRAHLAVVYASIFKKEYDMSLSPKVERILSRISNTKD